MHVNSLTCRIDTGFDGNEELRAAWDSLAIKVGAPVYMSYDWVRLWWKFYGKSSQLRLFVFSDGHSLVGVLPFYLASVGLWPINVRVARLVGANIPPKVFNPPVVPEFSAEVWGTALRHLLIEDRCDIVSAGPLSETYAGLDGLSHAALKNGLSWATGALVERDVHTVYYLARTFDEFLAALDGKERKIRRKKLRELEAKGPIRVEVVKDPAAVEREFETFAQQHTTQWEAEGRPGHFHAWPRALEFNRELVKAHGKLGRVRFVRLLAGDQVVANQYNYAFGQKLFAELPSRAAGQEWDRLSLGCSSQVKLLETCIAEGFETMESGLGHYDYKLLLGGREHRVLTLRLHSKQTFSRVRGRACSILRDLLVLVSQKLWYRRISPCLPKSLRSGQSEFTLAYDF